MVGMELFKGKVQYFGEGSEEPTRFFCGNLLLNGSSFAQLNYCKNNFNDVLSSFILLVELTVVNQWHHILQLLPSAGLQHLRGFRPGGLLHGVLGGEERPADVRGEEDRGAAALCGTVRLRSSRTDASGRSLCWLFPQISTNPGRAPEGGGGGRTSPQPGDAAAQVCCFLCQGEAG
ncbi:unnamed protein product [Tetraodon nigroviridis]|uniref:(spotted green pufferfish) hypothetical protein n=1 Tax=Tetraodon nigroviridis TaxID=99883 RepID=Q4T194_TETNG|nr:unnamed protein product [Tetraodon nigroviridis]